MVSQSFAKIGRGEVQNGHFLSHLTWNAPGAARSVAVFDTCSRIFSAHVGLNRKIATSDPSMSLRSPRVRLVPRSQKDPRSRIRWIQDLGSRWILDPAAQFLSRDPGDLGSSASDFARDPMDLGSYFFRGILSVFTDFITSMTCFVLNSRNFGLVYILHGLQGILDILILILCVIQRDLGS